ncbi:TAGLN [Lepeophtheirus salmonis]|uniref:Myophilin n=1 Tax=Lepeophtheirus salmonis TaxID=72036 RepID=C1BTY3_LEPSM|nr:myophilin-like [Lepeophtheirus salmonis]ACO12486.1 Myophilin [Lepeophtheirus salmonis]CAB4055086.1 TAGLN [Lepeophtheirus salmonis]CAF2768556.1 TAGLN [Lepeophtheirus salmonis]
MAPAPKRDEQQETEIIKWIEEVLGSKLPNKPYEDLLRDGVILCHLINKISPGSVKKILENGTNFQLMENIERFQKAIKKYGVPNEEIFQTPDLFERRNLRQVTICLLSLARITQMHPEYEGPSMGPKMSTENKRNFSEEDARRMRDGQIGLQSGFNKGATQSGQSFGTTRHM